MGFLTIISWLACLHVILADNAAMISQQINPDIESIPLYGPSGLPQLEDINQMLTSDCWLEAVLAAIVQIDPEFIVNMLTDKGDGGVIVKLFDEGGSDVSTTVKKKTRETSVLDKNSQTPWVQVIQDALEDQLNKEEPGSDPIFKGGFPSRALSAIYGRPSLNVICDGINDVVQNATSTPIIISTNATSGELASDHAYSIFGPGDLVNGQPTLILHNPWGFIKKKDGIGDSTLWGPDMIDRGHGSFQIPVTTVLLQCEAVSYLDPQDGVSKRDFHQIISRAQPRRTGGSTIGVILGVMVVSVIILMCVIIGFLKSK